MTIIPGLNLTLLDDPAGGVLTTATDTAFLLTADANAPAAVLAGAPYQSASSFRSVNPTATAAQAEVDTLFGEGAQNVYVVKIPAGAISGALALIPASLGSGQVVAPSVITSADIGTVAAQCLADRRIYLANGAPSSTDAAITTLAAAVVALGASRFTGMWVDTAIIPAASGSGTRNVPLSVAIAGVIARNDLAPGGGNPNLAAAGPNGVFRYVTGVVDERSDARRTALRTAQVNCAKTVAGGLRNYGYRTLADLTVLKHWWDLGGSRVVMDVCANALASSEDVAFGQIDGDQTLENLWNTKLSKRCLDLVRLGALFDKDLNNNPVKPFTVDTSRQANPVAQIAAGKVTANMTLRTSPYAEDLEITLNRRALTAAA